MLKLQLHSPLSRTCNGQLPRLRFSCPSESRARCWRVAHAFSNRSCDPVDASAKSVGVLLDRRAKDGQCWRRCACNLGLRASSNRGAHKDRQQANTMADRQACQARGKAWVNLSDPRACELSASGIQWAEDEARKQFIAVRVANPGDDLREPVGALPQVRF